MLAEIATVSGAGGKVRTARAVHTWSTTAGVVDQAGKQASGTGDPRAALEAVPHQSGAAGAGDAGSARLPR